MKPGISTIFMLAILAVITETQLLGISYRPHDAFAKFVTGRMENDFKKWFVSKIFDENVGFQPPLKVDESNCRFSLTGEMSEVRTTGGLLSNFTIFGFGNILGGSLFLHVGYIPEGIQGKYNLNGTIFNEVPINGHGFFRVIKPPTIYSILNFTNFCITPNGHIDLSCANLENRTATIGFGATRMEMDEMSVGGFEETVSQYLLLHLAKNQWNINPLTGYVQRFLQEEFNSTTVQNIVTNFGLADGVRTTEHSI